MINTERRSADCAHTNHISEVCGRALVETHSPNLPIVVIQDDVRQWTEVSGNVGDLALQNITHSSEKVERIPRRTAQRAVKSELERDGAAERHEIRRERLGQRFQQQPCTVQVFVVDMDRRLMPAFRWRQSGDREFDNEDARRSGSDIEC